MLYSDMQTNRKVKTKVPITSGMNTTIGLVLQNHTRLTRPTWGMQLRQSKW